MKYEITNDCVACGTCIVSCRTNAIVQGDEHYEITDACTSCGDCVDTCPVHAIVEYIPIEITDTMSKASFNEAMTNAGFNDETTRISKENLKKVLTELANAIWFDAPVILVGASGFISKTTIEMKR